MEWVFRLFNRLFSDYCIVSNILGYKVTLFSNLHIVTIVQYNDSIVIFSTHIRAYHIPFCLKDVVCFNECDIDIVSFIGEFQWYQVQFFDFTSRSSRDTNDFLITLFQ